MFFYDVTKFLCANHTAHKRWELPARSRAGAQGACVQIFSPQLRIVKITLSISDWFDNCVKNQVQIFHRNLAFYYFERKEREWTRFYEGFRKKKMLSKLWRILKETGKNPSFLQKKSISKDQGRIQLTYQGPQIANEQIYTPLNLSKSD